MNPDVLVVGGGPVGSVLALALQLGGRSVTLLEARSKGAAYADQRALALSYGTRLILERLGVWDELMQEATPINSIHISQRGSFGRSLLKAEEHGLPALGYVLSYGNLCKALDMGLSKCRTVTARYGAEALEIIPSSANASLTFLYEGTEHKMETPLLVLADGGKSLRDIPGIRRETKSYGHDAIVSKVECELPHNNVAYERFTSMGPVALLPNGKRDFSLVWTGKHEEIESLMLLDDETFLRRLHHHFGDRVGNFKKIGKRITFPLKLSYLDPVTAPHLAVIGNAAQTMHPVAGQGFNVGLRDAYELAQKILDTPDELIGSESMLQEYRNGRKSDTRNGLIFTDFLVNVFSNEILGLSVIRGLGLGILDLLPSVKRKIVSKMSFGSHG